MRTWIKRQLYKRITSNERREARARAHEARRRKKGEPHRLVYFHFAEDPACALMAPLLLRLRERYDVQIETVLCDAPEAAAAPEPDRLAAYARADAERLARRFGLKFEDPLAEPDPSLGMQTLCVTAAAIEAGGGLEGAAETCQALWAGNDIAIEAAARRYGEADPGEACDRAAHGSVRRDRLGHFQSASVYYAGEWYWGADRLHYLEDRLRALGAQKAGAPDAYLAPALMETGAGSDASGAVLEIYPSLRSPYTYLAAERAFAMARRFNARVEIRFVLPMVMRNLPVPRRKGIYFLKDAKREADRLGLPFGDIADPLGAPAERGLAVLHHAVRSGQGEAFLTSFLRGVWAEGIDAGSDKGLRSICERAGVSWDAAQGALGDESWRDAAADNRKRLLRRGLWGVPSFIVNDDFAVWGQDRLWAVEEALAGRA